MKKIYNNPTVKVLALDVEDIITTSGELQAAEKGTGKVMTIEEIMGL